MPVFDFNNAPEEKKEVVCTYTTFSSNEKKQLQQRSQY